MKPAVWGSALGTIVVAGGAYAYVSYEISNGLAAALEAFNADEAYKVAISYDDLSVNPLFGTVEFENVMIANKEGNEGKFSVKSIAADLDLWNMEDLDGFKGGQLTGLEFTKDATAARIESAEIRGLDIPAIREMAETKTFTKIPLTKFALAGLHFKVPQGADQTFSIGEIGFETSQDGTELKELLYKDFAFDLPTQETSMKLGKMHIKGGDFSAFKGLIAAGTAHARGEVLSQAEIDSITDKLVDSAMGSFGFGSMEVSGFRMEAGNGLAVSLKNMYFKDVERYETMIIGGTYGIEDFEIKGLKNVSPQAQQILTIAEMEDLRLNLKSTSSFDKDQDRLSGTSEMRLDDLLTMSSQMAFEGIDFKAWQDRMRPFLRKQYGDMVTQIATGQVPEPQDPQAQIAEMIGLVKQAYTGFYSTVAMSVTLEDKGLNEKGLNVYSAMTGMTVDQLRQQFGMAATGNLTMLLGPATPEDLASTVNAYLAQSSLPLTLSIENTSPLTDETLKDIDATNWHQLFDIKLASGGSAMAGTN